MLTPVLSAPAQVGTVVEPARAGTARSRLAALASNASSRSPAAPVLGLRLAIEPTAGLRAQFPQPAIDHRGWLRADIKRLHGADDALEADIQFHIAILHATQNPFFGQFEELVRTALHTSIQFTNQFSGHTANVAQHREVLEAIKSGDGEHARATMYRLIDDVLTLIHEGRQKEPVAAA